MTVVDDATASVNYSFMPWKPEHAPEHLYKYRSIGDPQQREFLKEILVGNCLYWPSPSQFNDPFDCFPIASLAGSKTDRRKYIDRLIGRNMIGSPRFERRATKRRMRADDLCGFETNLQKVVNDRMTEIGVCSFSARCDDVLMWSHYADSHGGVCLRFTPTPIDEELFVASRVEYSPDRPVINIMKSTSLEWAEKALYTKADYWAYEKEWRVFDIHHVGRHKFRPGSLDGVILGARITEENRSLILQWIEARSAPTRVLLARFDQQRFRLLIEEVGSGGGT